MAIDSWSLTRVFGTWVDHLGNLLAGTYKIIIPARLTNSADDLIIPAGLFAQGALNTTPGLPSLSILCPCTDDPDIQQTGWKVTIQVAFSGGQTTEAYVIDVPIANRPIADGGNGVGVNLRTIALTSQIPPQVAMYGVGVAGGLAVLSADGQAVLDANGNPITGSGGGPADWDTLADKPAVIAAGDTAAEARAAISAQPAGSYATAAQGAKADSAVQPAGLTKTAVGLGNVDNTSDANKPVSTAQAAAISAAINSLVSGAPGTLDTLAEIATALSNDASFATTITNALAARVRTDTAAQGLTATQQGNARANIDVMPTRVFDHTPTSPELAALPNPCLVVVTS